MKKVGTYELGLLTFFSKILFAMFSPSIMQKKFLKTKKKQ